MNSIIKEHELNEICDDVVDEKKMVSAEQSVRNKLSFDKNLGTPQKVKVLY